MRRRTRFSTLLGLLSTFSFLMMASGCSTRVMTFTHTSAHTNAMAFAFEKLIVYQKAVDFADAICQRTEQFPRGYGFLADQLNRAALSIAANIAEGNGRFTKPDRRNFFGIARGSVQECVPLLELAFRRKLIPDAATHLSLKAQLEEVARMLSGLIKGLDNRDV